MIFVTVSKLHFLNYNKIVTQFMYTLNSFFQVMGSVNGLTYVLQKNMLEVLNHQPGRMFLFGRNNAEAETPVLWPPHAKS